MSNIVSDVKSFGGSQRVYQHMSEACGCPMNVGVFLPERAKLEDLPAIIFLSGLTCTEQNFITKGSAQRIASELNIILIAPDTSPRGDDIPDDPDSYDFGKGAGFYINATEEPWAKNYQMERYITEDLIEFMKADLPIDMSKIGITGHSMGGHGAITLHLKNPDVFKTCSAFAPISNPSKVPWGKKAFTGYIGEDESLWLEHDSVALVSRVPSKANILVDQGSSDNFLAEQLEPSAFIDAAKGSGQKLSHRMQDGYDHSYYFVSTFMEDHIKHHVEELVQLG